MEEHPIQGLMTTAMENLKDMVEVNTIIGDPIESPDGSLIIPVSKLGFGFAAGGSEFVPSGSSSSQSSDDGSGSSGDMTLPFGGGSGGGVSITPVAFLIVSSKGIKMVHLDEHTHIYEKIIDYAPKAVEKIQSMLKESSSGQSQSKSKKDSKSQEKQGKKDRKKRSKEKEQDDMEDEDDDEMEYDI